MKYFIDTEFIEGTQKTLFGQTKPTIELISIGIVCEDGREYYAISKDFNLKEAWNRYDEKVNVDYNPSFGGDSDGHYNPQFIKVYWIRENVLKPIYWDMMNMGDPKELTIRRPNDFNYKNFKRLLNKYGKTNKQIAEEIKEFVYGENYKHWYDNVPNDMKPKFYSYYADYDWVVFCWLFGKMIDLPKGFPMYCIDLKQESDRIQKFKIDKYKAGDIKTFSGYPKQINEHHALMDARWTKQLYEFLKNLR